jgi:hypothetical protein
VNQVDPSTGLISHPLDSIGTSASWLRNQLAEESVRVHPSSHLADALGRLDDFRERVLRHETFNFATTETAYDFVADAVGADFLSKAVHAGWEAGLRLPQTRWAHLASGNPILIKPGPHSTERNLVWELVIASLTATFATDVRFDEPDIVCTFHGETFAIAAKVAYSEKKLFENVEEGFRQAKGKAAATLVFVDVVALYPVIETLRWSRSRNFAHNNEATSVMTGSFTRWCDRFALEQTAKRLRERAKHPVGVASLSRCSSTLLACRRPSSTRTFQSPGQRTVRTTSSSPRSCERVARSSASLQWRRDRFNDRAWHGP